MTDFSPLLADVNTKIALVGATDNPAKYGSIIYRDLKRKGYTVYPVNPHRPTVNGDQAYPTLSDLPVAPDIVNLVIPAEDGLDVVREAEELGYSNIWLQPGAESVALLRHLDGSGLDYIANACIMVRARLAVS